MSNPQSQPKFIPKFSPQSSPQSQPKFILKFSPQSNPQSQSNAPSIEHKIQRKTTTQLYDQPNPIHHQ